MGSRSRYLLYNLCVWVSVLIGGAAFLGAVRHYGTAYRTRNDALAIVRNVETALEQGHTTQVQADLLKVLEMAPALSGEVVDRFGPQLLAMPRVIAKLEDGRVGADDLDPSGEDVLHWIKLSYILGHEEGASQGLAIHLFQGGGTPQAYLWSARLAAQRGDFALARKGFDAYWRTRKRERALAAQALPSALRLFEAGLWDEAFEQVSAVRESGAATPEHRFLDGVRHDLDGRTAEAIEEYEAVLAQRPHHLLSLRGLARLQKSSS